MRGATTVELVLSGIDRLEFPLLVRPPVGPGAPPTEELIQWGTKLYVYSMLAHIRKVLAGLLVIAQTENVPTANVLSRHLFECSAQACYMYRRLQSCYETKDWNQAWEVLTPAAIGNLWANRYGEKYTSVGSAAPSPVANPIRVGIAVSEYEEYQSQIHGWKEAKDTYGLLSELSHPNSACLQQYIDYGSDGRTRIGYTQSPSPLPFVNWCLIDLLLFAEKLLQWAGDALVRPVIRQVLSEIAKRAPKTRA